MTLVCLVNDFHYIFLEAPYEVDADAGFEQKNCSKQAKKDTEWTYYFGLEVKFGNSVRCCIFYKFILNISF